MGPADTKNHRSRISELENRIKEAPHLVIDYVRLAFLLEESGDLSGAAKAFQKAHFLLPNSQTIVMGLSRLSDWIDATPAPIIIAASDPEPDVEEEEPVEEPPVREVQIEDELDVIIEGLGKARLGPNDPPQPAVEPVWENDDGLLATETLAHIYVAQKQYAEAVLVYDRLAQKEQDPEKATELRQKATALRKNLREPS